MKQYWQRIAQKIDGRTLRERVIVFALSVLVLIMLANTVLLDPQAEKQQRLSRQLKHNQAKMGEIQAELQQRARADAIDPDAVNRNRLQALQQESAQLHAALKNLQKGIVSPDKMSSVLESMLKQNGRLQLMSLRSIEASGVADSTPAPATTSPLERATNIGQPNSKGKAAGNTQDYVYKHGVELVVQGSYSDLTAYLTALESLPWQLYWGNVRLKVEEYPKATLVFTVFTLSLDRKWLNT